MRFRRKEDMFELEQLVPDPDKKRFCQRINRLRLLAEWLECRSLFDLIIIFMSVMLLGSINYQDKLMHLSGGLSLLIAIVVLILGLVVPYLLSIYVCCPLGGRVRDKILELSLSYQAMKRGEK